MTFSYVQLDHVQLAAPPGSEEKARTFYRDILLFREIEKPPILQKNGGVWFQAGDVHLHIGIDDPFVPAKKAHPAIQMTHIDALIGHLQDKGIEVELDDQLPGARRFYLNDPFDNRLEFLQWLE